MTLRIFVAVIEVLALPLLILNNLAGITSMIWLAVLGQWKALGIGIGAFFISGMLIGYAMMPALLFVAPGMRCEESGRKVGLAFFTFLATAYKVAVLTAWCMGVLVVFERMADQKSLLPLMLSAYAVSTGPIAWLASKDQEAGTNEFSAYLVFFTSSAYIVAVLMVLFGHAAIPQIAVAFAAVMTIGMVFIGALARDAQKVRERAGSLGRQFGGGEWG